MRPVLYLIFGLFLLIWENAVFLFITQANVTVSKNLSVGQKLLAERCPVEVWPKIFITIDAAVNHLLETSSIYRSSLGKNRIVCNHMIWCQQFFEVIFHFSNSSERVFTGRVRNFSNKYKVMMEIIKLFIIYSLSSIFKLKKRVWIFLTDRILKPRNRVLVHSNRIAH